MNKLQVDQLHQKMLAFDNVRKVKVSDKGWVHAIRTTLGMSLEHLGKKLSLTRQSVRAIELREADGSITINSLKEAAKALDMELVYGFVPIDGTLQKYIDRKATELATEIVMRTSHSMKLEGQENSPRRLKEAIVERTNSIKNGALKILWN